MSEEQQHQRPPSGPSFLYGASVNWAAISTVIQLITLIVLVQLGIEAGLL